MLLPVETFPHSTARMTAQHVGLAQSESTNGATCIACPAPCNGDESGCVRVVCDWECATCATFSAGLSPERINTVWMRTDKVRWATLHDYPRERDDCSWTFDTPKATFTSRNCYGFDATITVDARSGYPLKTEGYILAVQRPLKLILQLILSLTFSIHVWLLRQSTAIHTSSPKTAMPSEAMPAIHAVLRQLK